MTDADRVASLETVEDRLLYHLVELTGEDATDSSDGVSEKPLARALEAELGARGHVESRVIRMVQKMASAPNPALSTRGNLADWKIWPTEWGRRRVAQWKAQWRAERTRAGREPRAEERRIQLRILEDLDRQRREHPGFHHERSRIDVGALCDELGVTKQQYLAAGQLLLERGEIKESPWGDAVIEDGWVYITEEGVRALERETAALSSAADDRDAEIDRLRAQLKTVQLDPSSLVADDELRRRCLDLLQAESDYDRAVSQACLVLETRVRAAIHGRKDRNGQDLLGTALMELAFTPNAPLLRFSENQAEQRGAMELYRGVTAFFRNSTGHNIIDAYTRNDALRIVAWVDQLLAMLPKAVYTSARGGADHGG
jgi:hypothetical protein